MSMSKVERNELNAFLMRVKGGAIPNIEALDGFFAALACRPDVILPSEYMPVIQRGANEEGDLIFEDMAEAQRFMRLISRFYNDVNGRLGSENAYIPPLVDPVHGVSRAEDWAKAFMTGARLRPEIWSELVDDEDQGGLVLPIMMLSHEKDPDPEYRIFEIETDENQRKGVIAMTAATVMRMYHYFRQERFQGWFPHQSVASVRKVAKVGRNEPCPCGSGRKFKRCCARTETIH